MWDKSIGHEIQISLRYYVVRPTCRIGVILGGRRYAYPPLFKVGVPYPPHFSAAKVACSHFWLGNCVCVSWSYNSDDVQQFEALRQSISISSCGQAVRAPSIGHRPSNVWALPRPSRRPWLFAHLCRLFGSLLWSGTFIQQQLEAAENITIYGALWLKIDWTVSLFAAFTMTILII